VRRGAILSELGLDRSSLFYAHGVHGPLRRLTVSAWLRSVSEKGHVASGRVETASEKDRLSLPRGGSAAMGRFEVETDPGENDTLLVKFETRATRQGNQRPVEEWVPYARERFRQTYLRRNRPGTSTELEYEPADCPP
jgi:hypothetical protein